MHKEWDYNPNRGLHFHYISSCVTANIGYQHHEAKPNYIGYRNACRILQPIALNTARSVTLILVGRLVVYRSSGRRSATVPRSAAASADPAQHSRPADWFRVTEATSEAAGASPIGTNRAVTLLSLSNMIHGLIHAQSRHCKIETNSLFLFPLKQKSYSYISDKIRYEALN